MKRRKTKPNVSKTLWFIKRVEFAYLLLDASDICVSGWDNYLTCGRGLVRAELGLSEFETKRLVDQNETL